LSKNIDGVISDIVSQPVEFEVKHLLNSSTPAKNRQDIVEFQKKVAKLQQAVSASNQYLSEISKNLKLIKSTILNTNVVDTKLLEKVRKIEYRLEDLQIVLYGNSTIAKRNDNQTPSVNDRMGNISWSCWDIDSEPTGTSKTDYEIVSKQLKDFLKNLKEVVQNDINPLQNELQKNNAPWTPGREPIWE
jgi:hypothetical protein